MLYFLDCRLLNARIASLGSLCGRTMAYQKDRCFHHALLKQTVEYSSKHVNASSTPSRSGQA
eukprot:5810577-Amphidinium_carterae.1